MKRTLRWAGPILASGALLLLPWGCYAARPTRALDLAIVDKTVPFANRLEHRSLYWLLRHRKVVQPDGRAYDSARDYLGAFPGPTPGDPPARTTELTSRRAVGADLVYLVDTYGVYEEDLASGAEMKAALERSPKIYGGLATAEVDAVERAIAAGVPVVAEFNAFASPTGALERERMERMLGVRWTHWVGRYFGGLDDPAEVPRWLVRVWEREHGLRWEFRGAGYVVTRDDTECEVLRSESELERIGLTIERERPVDPLVRAAHDGVGYGYWFDVVEAAPGATTLASYAWHATPGGRARLEARGLPARFPAIVRAPAARAWYFAGDFADNPLPEGERPFAGWLALRKTTESLRLAPSVDGFYWRFYAPLVDALLDEAER
jgi:hypothetical protein